MHRLRRLYPSVMSFLYLQGEIYETLLPEVLTPRGILGISSDSRSPSPCERDDRRIVLGGKILLCLVDLSRELFWVFKTIKRFVQFPRIPAA